MLWDRGAGIVTVREVLELFRTTMEELGPRTATEMKFAVERSVFASMDFVSGVFQG